YRPRGASDDELVVEYITVPPGAMPFPLDQTIATAVANNGDPGAYERRQDGHQLVVANASAPGRRIAAREVTDASGVGHVVIALCSEQNPAECAHAIHSLALGVHATDNAPPFVPAPEHEGRLHIILYGLLGLLALSVVVALVRGSQRADS